MFGAQWHHSSPGVDRGFMAVPFKVYAEDPHWLGERSHDLQKSFSEANTYFEQGEAWLGCLGETRLAGFFEKGFELNKEPVAYFGFWETNNNLEANRSLFSELEKWAKSKGARALYGPINFSTFGNYRLRVDSFHEPAFMGEPYNPSYYPDLLEKLQFEVCQRYQSRFHPDAGVWAEQVAPEQKKLSIQLQSQFSMQSITPDLWLGYLPQIHSLVEAAFSKNFGYRSIPARDFERIYGESYIAASCPVTSQIVLDSIGELAGFFVCFPDYAELINGRIQRNQISRFEYATHFSKLTRPRTLLAKTGAVNPKYRNQRIFTWMCNQLIISSVDDYQSICAALMRDDNHSMNYGSKFPNSRHYALFKKRI